MHPHSPQSLQELLAEARPVNLSPAGYEHIDTKAVSTDTRAALDDIFNAAITDADGKKQTHIIPSVTLCIEGTSVTCESVLAFLEYACALHGQQANDILTQAAESYWRQIHLS